MSRSIVESSLRLRPLVLAIAVVVMTLGITTLDDMPVDVYPEILPVTVSVQTEALGLSAAEVEQLITVPIEADLLSGTPWVEVMRSESVPGLSSIELTFKRGTNPMHARQVVQERLTQAHALPNVSKPPQMLQPLSSTNRIMMIGLSSKSQSLIETSVLARWTIRPRLMGVPGVANVAIWGQRERQLQVQVDPQRLKDSKVTLLDIIKTAGNSLWYSPLSFLESSVAGTGGFVETPNQRIGVRHVLPISKASDLAKVPVEGSTMRLDEVATVIQDHQPLIGDAMNGQGSGLMLVVEKLPGVNTLEVTDEIIEALEALKPGLGGIEFDPNVYRPETYIKTSINNTSSALLIGLILVAVMMFLLTYNWRAALVGVIAIPLSLAAAALVIYYTGATVNVMVLAGLVVALGILVDDGIVFSDALLRRLRQGPGTSQVQTFLDATSEVRTPLAFATVVVLLAALPLLFMTGAAGAFVKPLAMSYGIAVLASMLVAMTVTPALSMMLYQKSHIVRHQSPFSNWLTRRHDNMSPMVPKLAVGLAIVAAVVGFAMLPGLNFTTAPTFKEHDLMIHWEATPGTSREEMNRLIERVSKELRGVPGVRNVGGHVGRAILSDQVVGMNSSELWVNLDTKANYEATVAAIENIVQGYPGIDADVMTYLSSRFGEPLSRVDEPIVVRVYGQEKDILRAEAEKVKKALAGVKGVIDARIDAESNEPAVEIEVNLQQAMVHGVKPGEVRRTAATLLAGIEVGNLFEEQKVFEVVVWGEPHIRHSVAGIKDLLIDTPSGGHVRLGDVAEVRIVPAPTVIRRENVARSLDVVANVSGRQVPAVAADVHRGLREMSFPLEYRAELTGDYAKQQAAMTRVFALSLAVAIGIVFVLQAAFGSWLLALAVVLTLPIALAGGAIAAVVTGSAVSLGSLAGFLTVLGLAVRYGVLLVGRYRELRGQGSSFGPELVRSGTRERVSSILMSAIVTAAAVLPFAVFGARAGHEIVGPMAMVILGGLVTTTVYALCIIPALYSRFGTGAMPDSVENDDLDIAV